MPRIRTLLALIVALPFIVLSIATSAETQVGDTTATSRDDYDDGYQRGYADGQDNRDRGRQLECDSHLDCGRGGWCKDPGDGIKVCMSKGSHGEACDSSLDCGRGGWCKDTGRGYKACMSKGAAGQVCDGDLDCGRGLWCKPDRRRGGKSCR